MYKTIIIICSALLFISIISLCFFVIRAKHSEKSINTAGFYVSVITTIISLLALVTNTFIGEKTANDFLDFSTNYYIDNSTELQFSETKNDNIITNNTLSETELQILPEIDDTTINEHTKYNETVELSSESITFTPKTAMLKDCTTYAYDGSVVFEDIVSDPRGNSYNKAYLFYGEYYHLNTGWGEYGSSCITKYLGSKYSRFTAVLNPYQTFDKYNKGIEATFNIYTEDKLVFTTTLSKSTENIQIELDVTNINYLKFELLPATEMTNYHNQYSVILSDATLIVG